MSTTSAELRAKLEELADIKAGIPSHAHTSTRGVVWRCASPYCERGGDIRDVPQHGPNETAADAERYRRHYA